MAVADGETAKIHALRLGHIDHRGVDIGAVVPGKLNVRLRDTAHVVGILAVGHARDLHRDDIALLGRQIQIGSLDKRFPLVAPEALRNLVSGTISRNQTLVGQDGMVNLALASTHLSQFEFVGLDDFHHGGRHVGLILHGGRDVVLVLDLGLLDIPTDGDGLIAEDDDLGSGGARVDQDIVAIGLVLVGCDVDLIVALGQGEGVEAVVAGLTLCYECAGDGILQHDLSSADVRLLLSIIGKLVGDIDDQRTGLVGDGRDVEVDVGAVAVLAVDADTSGDGHVELHVGGRHQSQHDGSGVVLVQAGHGGTRQGLHPFGQCKGNLASVALTVVADSEAVVAPVVLVHRGDEVLLLNHQVGSSRAGIVVDRNLEAGTLGRGDTHLEGHPVLTRRCLGGRYLVGHVYLFVAANGRGNRELRLTAVGSVEHLSLDTAQGQRTGILQTDDTSLRFADGHVAGDVSAISTLQAIDIESGQFLSSGVALEAGSNREVARLQGEELPFKGETAVGIGRHRLDVACAGIDHVDVNLGVGRAVAADLSADDHQVALTIDGLVGLDSRREGRNGGNGQFLRSIVGVEQLGNAARLVNNGIEDTVADIVGQRHRTCECPAASGWNVCGGVECGNGCRRTLDVERDGRLHGQRIDTVVDHFDIEGDGTAHNGLLDV